MTAVISYICVGLLGALACFILVALIIRLIRLRQEEIVSVEAVVSNMHTTDMSVIKSISLNADRNTNVVEFDVGGIKKELIVSKWVYGAVEIGDKGILTYKDNMFIDFEVFESDEEKEKQ